MDMDDEAPLSEASAKLMRYLKLLVTALAVTMILGFIVLIALLVMRFPSGGSVPFPAEIALPEGATVEAFTRGPDWLGVATTDGRMLIFSPDGQTLRQEITIRPAP